jgi:monoterpene epsilon-lactone hydrolase
MASWQAHTLDLIIRIQVKRKMKQNPDLAQVRKMMNAGTFPAPKDVEYRPDTVGGVAGEWVTHGVLPETAPVLLYLHGGGYLACSPKTHRPITGAFAKAGLRVWVPDYRLAPEHPFPAAVEDAQAAWHGLLARGYDAANNGVAGDSAGGGLSLALMLALRDGNHALPAAAVLFSPWTDLASTGESMVTNAKRDAMFHAPGTGEGAAYYLGGADARSPLASPLYADLHGLPPLLIHAGDREILRDDSTRLTKKARAAGVSVEERIWPVVPHVWQLASFVPEARESLKRAADFLISETRAKVTQIAA